MVTLNNDEELKQLLEKEFGNIAPPRAASILSNMISSVPEEKWVLSYYGGKRWMDVNPHVYRDTDSISMVLSPSGFRYYFPGFVWTAVFSNNRTYFINIVSHLCFGLNSELVEEYYLGSATTVSDKVVSILTYLCEKCRMLEFEFCEKDCEKLIQMLGG